MIIVKSNFREPDFKRALNVDLGHDRLRPFEIGWVSTLSHTRAGHLREGGLDRVQ